MEKERGELLRAGTIDPAGGPVKSKKGSGEGMVGASGWVGRFGGAVRGWCSMCMRVSWKGL